ncbi:photosystem reaction center subunit H [Streptomyces camponoticapitis]|uniref:Photosystem reaction center subunit H n=1 Tax=Streptomyces camponoticapitis TaxID=1616125 RepID=A0ABQ2DY95_9ACTN|nr:PRC and DUF2382 domain-containing protein [Streptomyces camponoticapitis]GGJ78528.1 photosystem reaction center subunit H [Streptomyces camponoticapitis]
MAADDVFHHVGELTGLTAYDADGEKIGSVEQAYLDNQTGRAEWVTVKTGMFGMKESFVPLAGATRDEGGLQIPHAKELVKDAPRMDADEHLDVAQEQELYDHYGVARPSERSGSSGMSPAPGTAATEGRSGEDTMSGETEGAVGPDRTDATSQPGMTDRTDASAQDAGTTGRTDESKAAMAGATGGGDDEMVRSEERLRVGTEEHESGRARLRKVVVTENVTTTVPVTHEEVRIVREPIKPGDGKIGRSPMGNAEAEVILHAEEAVVRKEAVPVERVRMETEKVTEQKEVSADVRKEQVEFDAPGHDDRGRGGGRGPSH